MYTSWGTMHKGWNRKNQIAAKMIGLLMLADAGLALPQSAQSANYGVSAACGRDYVQNVIKIDGDVNFPTAVTVPQIAAMPGQQTLNLTTWV
jgi:hypothetical protein